MTGSRVKGAMACNVGMDQLDGIGEGPERVHLGLWVCRARSCRGPVGRNWRYRRRARVLRVGIVGLAGGRIGRRGVDVCRRLEGRQNVAVERGRDRARGRRERHRMRA